MPFRYLKVVRGVCGAHSDWSGARTPEDSSLKDPYYLFLRLSVGVRSVSHFVFSEIGISSLLKLVFLVLYLFSYL